MGYTPGFKEEFYMQSDLIQRLKDIEDRFAQMLRYL
jgi:hypothetical protein